MASQWLRKQRPAFSLIIFITLFAFVHSLVFEPVLWAKNWGEEEKPRKQKVEQREKEQQKDREKKSPEQEKTTSPEKERGTTPSPAKPGRHQTPSRESRVKLPEKQAAPTPYRPVEACGCREDIGRYFESLGGILGDVNGDGQISDDDAHLIGDYLVANLAALPHPELADVDWDSYITIIDAMLIAQTVTMGDRIPPGVLEILPEHGTRDVPPNTNIVVTFSEPVDPNSLDSLSFLLNESCQSCSGIDTNFVQGNYTVLPGDTIVEFQPVELLDYSTIYDFTVFRVKDANGNYLRGGSGVQFRTEANPALGPVGTVSGVVLDEEDLPVTGVAVKILDAYEAVDFGITTSDTFYYTNPAYHSLPTDTTDIMGRFFIDDVPQGRIKLLVDGRTASHGDTIHPPTTYLLDVIANQDNSLRRPIYMQRIDIQNMVPLRSDTVTVITSPLAPGFSLKIEPGSAKFYDGSPCEALGVTIIPKKTEPSPPPPGYGFDVCYRLYPTGVYFDPPAAVTYPAPDSLDPGDQVELAEYDYDAGKYIVTGKLTVNGDGTLLESDAGVGLIWTCCHNPIYRILCTQVTSCQPALSTNNNTHEIMEIYVDNSACGVQHDPKTWGDFLSLLGMAWGLPLCAWGMSACWTTGPFTLGAPCVGGIIGCSIWICTSVVPIFFLILTVAKKLVF